MKLNKTLKALKHVLIFLSLLFLNSDSFAQSNALKLMFRGHDFGIGLGYEKALFPHTSLQIGVMRFNSTEWDDGRGLFSYSKSTYVDDGEGIFLDFRYYLLWNKNELSGLFLAPNFALNNHRVLFRRKVGEKLGGFLGYASVPVYGEVEEKVSSWSGGLKVGFQKAWSTFHIGFGANFSWNSAIGDKEGGTINGIQQPFNSGVDGFHPSGFFEIGAIF